jgi:hypothetical protein
MDAVLQVLCFFCAATVANEPYPQLARPFHDIRYTHERLGDGRHLLRLSTSDDIWNWEYDRSERLAAFAHDYAAQTCHGRYRLTDGERASWPRIYPTYAKQFVFRCG